MSYGYTYDLLPNVPSFGGGETDTEFYVTLAKDGYGINTFTHSAISEGHNLSSIFDLGDVVGFKLVDGYAKVTLFYSNQEELNKVLIKI